TDDAASAPGSSRREEPAAWAGTEHAAADDSVEVDPVDVDEEEGYVPPPPPPLPRMSKPTAIALTIIVFGLIMLFAPRFTDLSARQGMVVGFLALIGGICYLFWNLRDEPADDDRPDDGAVV
ncbi:MAG: hypothetical protein WCB04_09905, partial [Mycobacteriales bacterium]